MPRTILWLGALVCAGSLCSPAWGFRPFAGLRNGQRVVSSTDQPAPPGTTIVNGKITNSDANGAITNGCAGSGHGHGGGLCSKLSSAKECVNQWLLNVPQKQPPPPAPPVPINPYIRSPRDFFMVGDP
jgi:hypothetical protein